MKSLIVLATFILASLSLNAQSIEGFWNTGKDNTIVEIKDFEGVIESSDNLKATKGKTIIKELTQSGNEYKGKIYIIKNDRWIDAIFDPKGENLEVTITAGWKKKTVNWKKAK